MKQIGDQLKREFIKQVDIYVEGYVEKILKWIWINKYQ
jgi:hypothetical protein